MGSKAPVFVVDYDGTLSRENTPVEEKVLNAILSLKNTYGFKLVLATARPFRDIEQFVNAGIFDALILELGGVLHFPPSDIVVFKPKWWNMVIEKIALRVPPVNKGELLYYFDENHLPQALEVLNIISPTHPVEVKKVGSRTHVFAPQGLDKGVGLTRLSRFISLEKAEIIAIGDSMSDMPLFKAAGFRIAVANAEERIKVEADYVTKSLYGEGVVEGIRFFLEKTSGKKEEYF
ncbi:MAG: HAD family hydrolase [Infirmifilum sp.]